MNIFLIHLPVPFLPPNSLSLVSLDLCLSLSHTHTHTHTHTQPSCNTAAAAAKSLQSCPTLCDPIDGSSPGSAIPRILQARTLEWVAISFSNAWKWKVKVKSLSRIRPLVTPWTAAYQAPPPMGFSRQEYWSGLPLPSPLVILEKVKSLLVLVYSSVFGNKHISLESESIHN